MLDTFTPKITFKKFIEKSIINFTKSWNIGNMGCQQLLTPAGVTKEFIQLLKSLVKFQTQLSFP